MIPFLPFLAGVSAASSPAPSRPARKGEQAVTANVLPGSQTADVARLPYVSPFSPASDLNRLVWHDMFGDTAGVSVNSRDSAMRIAAVARGRNLIVSTICRFPFALFAGEEERPPAPWMFRTNDGSSWQLRNAWTVDDLMFYGWSLWRWTRGADSDGGRPLSGGRVPMGQWRINSDNRLEVDGEGVIPSSKERDYCLIPGLHEGLLSFGVDVLSDARALYAIVRDRIENPVPAIDLHQTGGEKLTETEKDELIGDWVTSRSSSSSRRGVAYSNEFIDVRTLGGTDGSSLLVEARNAAALDLARMIGIHGGMIDATTPKASLNYETTNTRNGEFVDFDLALYITPLTARLSLDDVTVKGERVALDLGDFLTVPGPSPTGPAAED